MIAYFPTQYKVKPGERESPGVVPSEIGVQSACLLSGMVNNTSCLIEPSLHYRCTNIASRDRNRDDADRVDDTCAGI